MIARAHSSSEAVNELLDSGASVDLCNLPEETALHLGARSAFVVTVHLIAKYGRSVYARTRNGHHPFHYAARVSRLSTIEALVLELLSKRRRWAE